MEKFKLKRSELQEAVKKGIGQHKKHNPSNDNRYPVETYIVSQLCSDIENFYMMRTNKKAYSGYRFISFNE